ncbi:hypothetical protein KCU65_g7034, partial [Aureobasidium melanogenum]
MPDEQPPCSRCQRRGIDCVLHTATRVVGITVKDIELLRKDVQNIHAVLGRLCESLSLEAPQLMTSSSEPVESQNTLPMIPEPGEEEYCELSPPASPSDVHAPIDTILGNSKPVASPGDSPNLDRRRTVGGCDLITKGLVSMDTANRLSQHYLTYLDPFLYGIASHHKNAESLRKASPALLAVICAVAALHAEGDRESFEVCNREFRNLVCSSIFEKRDIEHIRALCIGSFWMMNASRILSSDAIRRAADVRLHRHFYRLSTTSDSSSIEDQTAHRDRVRLWYLLFISDQHQAILHNRDPLMRQEPDFSEQMNWFLTSGGMTSQDARIVSQVSLLHIMSQIRDVFGADMRKPLAKSLSIQFNHFTRELDQWYSHHSLVFASHPDIGDFPAAGLRMHHQFAKLFLGHHVFRGLEDDSIPTQFLTAAATAYETATNIFNIVLEDLAFQTNLFGMPQYFHIMISFAGHFLLEVCAKHRDQLGMNLDSDLSRIRAVLAHFARIKAIPRHAITRVTTGLLRQLQRFTSTLGIDSGLDGSPFIAMDLLNIPGSGPDVAPVSEGNGGTFSFDMQAGNTMPFPDLPSFAFQDLDFEFLN